MNSTSTTSIDLRSSLRRRRRAAVAAAVAAMLSLACATAGLVPFTAQPQFRKAVGNANNVRMSTLYDMPVSNHGARVRLLLYKKGLESEVAIAKPGDLGGLVSDEYKALNPQCKICLLYTSPSPRDS